MHLFIYFQAQNADGKKKPVPLLGGNSPSLWMPTSYYNTTPLPKNRAKRPQNLYLASTLPSPGRLKNYTSLPVSPSSPSSTSPRFHTPSTSRRWKYHSEPGSPDDATSGLGMYSHLARPAERFRYRRSPVMGVGNLLQREQEKRLLPDGKSALPNGVISPSGPPRCLSPLTMNLIPPMETPAVAPPIAQVERACSPASRSRDGYQKVVEHLFQPYSNEKAKLMSHDEFSQSEIIVGTLDLSTSASEDTETDGDSLKINRSTQTQKSTKENATSVKNSNQKSKDGCWKKDSSSQSKGKKVKYKDKLAIVGHGSLSEGINNVEIIKSNRDSQSEKSMASENLCEPKVPEKITNQSDINSEEDKQKQFSDYAEISEMRCRTSEKINSVQNGDFPVIEEECENSLEDQEGDYAVIGNKKVPPPEKSVVVVGDGVYAVVKKKAERLKGEKPVVNHYTVANVGVDAQGEKPCVDHLDNYAVVTKATASVDHHGNNADVTKETNEKVSDNHLGDYATVVSVKERPIAKNSLNQNGDYAEIGNNSLPRKKSNKPAMNGRRISTESSSLHEDSEGHSSCGETIQNGCHMPLPSLRKVSSSSSSSAMSGSPEVRRGSPEALWGEQKEGEILCNGCNESHPRGSLLDTMHKRYYGHQYAQRRTRARSEELLSDDSQIQNLVPHSRSTTFAKTDEKPCRRSPILKKKFGGENIQVRKVMFEMDLESSSSRTSSPSTVSLGSLSPRNDRRFSEDSSEPTTPVQLTPPIVFHPGKLKGKDTRPMDRGDSTGKNEVCCHLFFNFRI